MRRRQLDEPGAFIFEKKNCIEPLAFEIVCGMCNRQQYCRPTLMTLIIHVLVII